jgi:hypothetical protein
MHSRISILLMSVVVAVGLMPYAKATTSRTSHASPLEISEIDSLDIYIERLAFLESSGRESIIVLDTNGRLSKSCLQFQEATWEEQTRIHEISGSIMDCQLQKVLARKMLESDPRNARHWKNSTRRLGPPPLRQVPSAG